MKKMQMRLMSGVATVLFPLFSSHAQVCTPTPDCATMGYNKTEEQCVGLSVVRCPYDINKLFCTDGQTGGDVNVGDILYSDGSTSSLLISNKVPIGVVFYVTNSRKDILAVALQDGDRSVFESTSYGGTQYFAMNMAITAQTKIYEDENSAIEDMDGKTSVDEILKNASLGSNYLYERVKNYKTVGTNRANWFIPSAGQLKKLLDNMFAVNTTLGKISTAKIMSGNYISSTFGGCTYGVNKGSNAKYYYCNFDGGDYHSENPGGFWSGKSDAITTTLSKLCSKYGNSSSDSGSITGGFYFVIRDTVNYRPIINVGNIGAACEAKCFDSNAQRNKCSSDYYQVESGDDGCGGVCYRCYKGKSYYTTSACTGCTQNERWGDWRMQYTTESCCDYKTGGSDCYTSTSETGAGDGSYDTCQDMCGRSSESSGSNGYCAEVTAK